MRILDAAHHAPSVGFMQPWNFILVRDRQIRAQVSAAFAHGWRPRRRLSNRSGAIFTEASSLRESSGRRSTSASPVIARAPAPRGWDARCNRTPTCSARPARCRPMACGASRRRRGGLGQHHAGRGFAGNSGIPEEIAVVAYLCVGYVDRAYVRPELEVKRWARRLPLEDLVFDDIWGRSGALPVD